MTATTRPALLLLAALGACAPENQIVEEPPDNHLDPRPPVVGDLFVPPEEPRFYLLEVPVGAAVSDLGHVLMYDPWTGGDVYLWTEEAGIEWVTTTGAFFNSVDDISADGTKIIGSYGNYMDENDNTQAATWTLATGWTKLGALPGTLDCPMQSAGWSLSADGSVGAGLAFADGCEAYGFRWDAVNGMTPYDQVGTGGNRVTAISDNGELAVGFAQGNAARTPAAWFADGTGQVLNLNWNGEFYGVNAAGTKAVGQFGTKAAVWTVGASHTFLGTLSPPGESRSRAVDICGADDDEVIIGDDTTSGGIATVWTAETGLIQTSEWLEGLGVILPDNTRLLSSIACSPDKRFIIGQGAVGDETGVWVAILPGHLFQAP